MRRVATGLSDEERRDVSNSLQGNLAEYEDIEPPSLYKLKQHATGKKPGKTSKERPDCWVRLPPCATQGMQPACPEACVLAYLNACEGPSLG